MSHVYLLGAGFSNAISNKKYPLMKCLSKETLKKFHELKKHGEDSKDIEVILSLIDLKLMAADNNKKEVNNTRSLRERVTKFIHNRFKTLQPNEYDSSLGMKFVKCLEKDDSILTINYDCLLEELMLRANVWSPNGGWSKYIQYEDLREYEENCKKKNIEIIKLHGSVNFWVDNLPTIGLPEPKGTIVPHVKKSFLPSCKGKENPANTNTQGQYIIDPTFIKSYHRDLLWLWKLATKKMWEADIITIIGCGLRPEDTMLTSLISASIKDSILTSQRNRKKSTIKKEPTIEIVDPKPNDVIEKLERISLRLRYRGNKIIYDGENCLEKYIRSRNTSKAQKH